MGAYLESPDGGLPAIFHGTYDYGKGHEARVWEVGIMLMVEVAPVLASVGVTLASDQRSLLERTHMTGRDCMGDRTGPAWDWVRQIAVGSERVDVIDLPLCCLLHKSLGGKMQEPA